MLYIPRWKRCAKCGHNTPASNLFFILDNRRRDGLGSHCRLCKSASNKNYRDSDPEKTRARKRKYREGHLEEIHERERLHRLANLDAYRERDRQQAAKRKDKKRLYDRQYRDANREFILKRQQRWTRANVEKVRLVTRASQARRRAAKLRSESHHTASDVRLQYKSQGGRCWWCGKPVGERYDVDHRIPLSRGGSDGPENICISCPSCNRRKNYRLPWEWNGRLL
jgi:hypothetical protein